MNRNDLSVCKVMLNADLFREQYPRYPLANLRLQRDHLGIPTGYSETSEKVYHIATETFRKAIAQRTKSLNELGHAVEETLTLQTNDKIRVNYAEIYAMIQMARALSNDELQTEITTGLMRLAAEQPTAPVFMSLCKSIYVFWNYPALQKGFSAEDLDAIDMLQRYMNGALWAAELHGDLSGKSANGPERPSRTEPPMTRRSHEPKTKPSASEEVGSNVVLYADLLEISAKPDPVEYNRKYGDQGRKNSAGIPLALEDQAEAVGRIISSAYEEKYDQIKAEMQSRGIQFSAVISDDAGQTLSVNFAAVATAPIVSKITDETDLVPYCVAALHWLLASEDHEWVFSHLVEATGAFFRSDLLRKQLGEGYADAFNDLRDLLREALYQYIHRHV